STRATRRGTARRPASGSWFGNVAPRRPADVGTNWNTTTSLNNPGKMNLLNACLVPEGPLERHLGVLPMMHRLFLITATILLGWLLPAQELLWEIPPHSPQRTSYSSLAPFADFDGDGYKDLIQ